jgi:hypothetical protein
VDIGGPFERLRPANRLGLDTVPGIGWSSAFLIALFH